MGLMFIDIETYKSAIEPLSSLNPYLTDSKVIVISYNIYEDFGLNEKKIREPTFLFEWESSEEKILNKFYTDLKHFVENEKYPKLVGFNHSNFDLSYLYGRLHKAKIDKDKNLHEIIFRKPRFIDLMQISIQFSDFTRKYGELGTASQKKINKFFGISIKEAEGNDLSSFYDAKQFELIKKYVSQEFTFETLYIRLREQFNICREKNCFKEM